jgi:hypothetical protein
MENIKNIDEELIKKIRSYINRIENQNLLMQNINVWHQLCVSLDTIEDSMWAIQYYIDSEYPQNFKGKYLYTYGLLQAIFMQQDALSHINLSLFDKTINYKNEFPELFKIREIRNDVVGHPTQRNRENKKIFINISQISMTKHSFEYMVSHEGKNEFKSVDVVELINIQNHFINDILKRIVDRQNKEFEEYINMHRDKKLEDIFKGLHYKKEKILIPSYGHINMKITYLDSIKQMIEECKSELNNRYVSWEEVDFYNYIIKDIDEMFFLILDILPKVDIEEKESIEKYLLQHLFCNLDDLLECLKETDMYFENYGQDETKDIDSEKIEIKIVKCEH